MSAVYTLHIDAGATYSRSIEYLNDDGTPFDLDGFTALMQIRFKPDTDLVVETEPTIDVETGTISFTLTAEQTSLLTECQYVYAIELYAPGDEPTIRLIGGDVLTSPEVVRPEGS
jgi:hypothetical protein